MSTRASNAPRSHVAAFRPACLMLPHLSHWSGLLRTDMDPAGAAPRIRSTHAPAERNVTRARVICFVACVPFRPRPGSCCGASHAGPFCALLPVWMCTPHRPTDDAPISASLQLVGLNANVAAFFRQPRAAHSHLHVRVARLVRVRWARRGSQRSRLALWDGRRTVAPPARARPPWDLRRLRSPGGPKTPVEVVSSAWSAPGKVGFVFWAVAVMLEMLVRMRATRFPEVPLSPRCRGPPSFHISPFVVSLLVSGMRIFLHICIHVDVDMREKSLR